MTPDPSVLLRREPCPQCGQAMLWTQNAWVSGESRGAAYQCAGGHVIDPSTTRECPVCGLHDTRIVKPDEGDRTHVCNACGGYFETTR